LSEGRAKAVQNRLIKVYKVDSRQIESVKGEGEAGSEQGGDARLEARRVRIEAVGESCEPGVALPLDEYRESVLARLGSLTDPRFMIVLLPDPVDSHLARDFDIYLSALREAMGSMGYQMDQFELPWPRFGADGRPEIETRWVAKDAESIHMGMTRYRRTPGVMIYRRAAGDQAEGPAEIVVYVVGETPTWGVQAQAFRDAWKRASRRAARSGGRDLLTILGPTYSGTTDSLLHEIAGLYPRNSDDEPIFREIRVVSGTASSSTNIDRMMVAGVPYDQLPVTTERRLRQLVEYAKRLDPRINCDKKVLLLREDTVFGAPGQPVAGDKCAPDNLQSISYPINISELRQAHETLGAKDGPTRSSFADHPGGLTRDPIFQLSRLPLSLSGMTSPRDRPPIYGDLTPQTLDMMVGEILRKIDSEGVLAVGILGTNVKDKLFLAGEIARHADGIRLFTDEPDILLSHPRFSFATHGMMTVSSFGLEETEGGRHFFPSDAAHGVFRAAQELGRLLGADCPGAEGSALRLKDLEKPLWAGAVGRGRIVLTERYSNGAWRAAVEAGRALTGGRAWFLLFLLHLAAVFFFVWRAIPSCRRVPQLVAVALSLAPPFLVLLALRRYGDSPWLAWMFPSGGPQTNLALMIVPVGTFIPVLMGGALLWKEFREGVWSAVSGELKSRIGKASGVRKQALGATHECVWLMYWSVAPLVAFGYYLAASSLATARHLDLSSGLSLIPSASIAHLSTILFAALWVERRKLRLENGSFSDGRIRPFGFSTRPWWVRIAVLAAVALLALIGWFLDTSGFAQSVFPHTLEGSHWFNAFVTTVYLGVIVSAAEALVFAHRAVNSGRPQGSEQPPSDEKAARKFRTIWRASLAAGPVGLLLLLLAVEVYPFEPRGLLTLQMTVLILLATLAALWIVVRQEARRPRESKEGGGLAGVFLALSRESVPLGAAVFSVLGLLPNVRERMGGLVDLLARLIG
jgi:hypothetical protein